MSNTAIAHLDTTITHDGKTHTFSQACDHVAHLFDKRDDMAELVLLETKGIGEWLLVLRSVYKSDKQFGQAIAATPLSKRSAQDRNDAMFVANNWAKVQKLNAKGELNALGASAVRKRLKKAEAVGNTSKGKAKPEADAKPTDKVTAVEMAHAVLEQLAKADISVADFRKAFNAAAKASA
tara:strand:+ start:1685 stop:2224 length:540 start_codon:yes stop_codon:yes gene_type:complete